MAVILSLMFTASVASAQVVTAKAGPDQTVAAGASVTLDGGASSGGIAPLTYAWTQTDGVIVPLSDSEDPMPTFRVPDHVMASESLLTFRLVVTDARGAISSDTVPIKIRPLFPETVEDQTFFQNSPITPITLPNALGRNKTYTLTPLPAGLRFDGATRILSGTPEQTGSFKVTYGVTDGNGGTDSLSFFITVNEAPIAAAGPDQTVVEGASVTLRADLSAGDIFISWGPANGNDPAFEGITLPPANRNPYTFSAPTELAEDLILVFQLVAAAFDKTTIIDNVIITVTAGPNTAPTANAGVDRLVAEGTVVTLDGSNSDDPEDEELTYAWTQTAGAPVSLSEADTASPRFTAPSNLESDVVFEFSLTVTDARDLSSTAATVSITVSATAAPNIAPTADAGPDQPRVNEMSTVTLDGSDSDDPDGDNAQLTYAWTQTGGTEVTLSDITAQSPTFRTPALLAPESVLTFELIVTDTRGTASTADTVTITVSTTGDVTLPVISLLGAAAVSIELGTAYSDAGATV